MKHMHVSDALSQDNVKTFPGQFIKKKTTVSSEPPKLRRGTNSKKSEKLENLLTFSDGTPIYQWQQENESWRNYSKEHCAQIHEGYLNWQRQGSQYFVANEIEITARRKLFIIDLCTMLQTNDATGRFRKIRNKADTVKPCPDPEHCRHIDCQFFHPNGKDRLGLQEYKFRNKVCKFGETCHRVGCSFIHPIESYRKIQSRLQTQNKPMKKIAEEENSMGAVSNPHKRQRGGTAPFQQRGRAARPKCEWRARAVTHRPSYRQSARVKARAGSAGYSPVPRNAAMRRRVRTY